VGKAALYTVCAGIHPQKSLPVTLDVGTDNDTLLADPLYLGLKQPRLRGEAYDELIEEFITAAYQLYPHALIQFEDFGSTNAFRLLEEYQSRACVFNDDIQGTGSVVLGGLYSALRITGTRLTDQTMLFVGAGEAGIGTANIVTSAMTENGLSEEEARQRCWFVDSKGLVVESRDDLNRFKRSFAHDHEFLGGLLPVVESIRPTVLIGASGQPGIFTKPVLEAMASLNERPIVFSLSNPTSKTECTAEEAYNWTEGRALFASGSPFRPVHFNGKVLIPGQGNNAYIFPGVTLGVIACEATRITNEMFSIAAKALANTVAADDLKQGHIYPPLHDIRSISIQLATEVARVAYEQGLARKPEPDNLQAYIKSLTWEPEYPRYV